MYRFTYIQNLSSRKLKLYGLKNFKILPPANLKSKKPFLINVPMYLDTETSNNHNKDNRIGWMYSWCYEFNGEVVIGRNPRDFIRCLKDIKEYYDLNENIHMLIYVHNLSYDIQYLKNYLIAEFGDNFNMLAVNPHKFISFSIDCFDFRCTYKMSNKSLDSWGRALNTKHKKHVGEIDYDNLNYQDETLPKNEFKYQVGDVLTLHDCVEKTLTDYNDTLQSVPLTSTGYVRREVRNYIRRNDKNYRKLFGTLKVNYQTFKKLMLAYSGGYTHANRYTKDNTLKGNIRHRDFRSHYPSQLEVSKYPMSAFSVYFNDKDKATINDVLKLTVEYCCLIDIDIANLKIKKGVTMPYAQKCKMFDVNNTYVEDNGRLLQMDGVANVILTDIDLKIFIEQYTFDYKINTVQVATAALLPKSLRNAISVFFKSKSDLKSKEKTMEQLFGIFSDEKYEASYNLMKSKNMLNGIYGCMCTNPVRDEILMDAFGNWKTTKLAAADAYETLEKFYKNKKSFLHYQWGVWCTANARYELFEYMKEIGYENCLYCDTDSIFYISTPEIEKRIENLNIRKEQYALSIGAYITTDNGKIINYDNFSDENENITEFRALHSKCYAYMIADELHCTIAGVSATNKKHGDNKITREMELKTIDNLKHDYKFIECGGTSIAYTELNEPESVVINGHLIDYASSGIIEKTEKTLNNKDSLLDIDYIEIYVYGGYENE